MKRAALLAPRVAPPSPRAARRSEWLRSALAHHHRPDPGADNEIVVLATGMDQYLQEVFHHLVHPASRSDTMPAEDFTALCAVLGLTGAPEDGRTGTARDGDDDDEEFRDICAGLPGQLSFKDFHSRLCGYFRVRMGARRGTGECAWRLPVAEDTELVERQIRIRWPRARRRKRVSFDLTRDPIRSAEGRMTAEDRDAEELAALRELVEDVRSALQGSDARCLALEVALRRERGHRAPNPSGFAAAAAASSTQPTTSITLRRGKLVPTQRLKGQCGRAGGGGEGARRAPRKRDLRDPLVRELNLIRSSRDGQLDEAIKFNGRLEEELRWAYQEVHKLQGVEAALRRENAHIRRRAEEAREAVSMGLERVRMIQEQAQSVPQLQSRITQLETELHQYRSLCACIPDPAHQRASIGAEDACSKTDAECLQRAVEGRAASDEEEEDRALREERQRGPLELTKHISRLHVCVKGCPNHVADQRAPQSHLRDRNPIDSFKDSRGRCSWSDEQPEESKGVAKEKRSEGEEDKTRLEQREYTRLSLLEQKLSDVITLLLQLRNKNVSCGALGKIVMDTLDVCSRSGDGGPSLVLQVAEALCVRLSSRDFHDDAGDDEAGGGREELLQVPSPGCQKSSVNPLLISC